MEKSINEMSGSENKYEPDYDAQIAEINRALELNKKKMDEIENALKEFSARKIFTLKELKKMKEQQIMEEQKKLEQEKQNIDLITSKALEDAERLRNVAGYANDGNSDMLEERALNMELEAILHDIEIRKIIISEKENQLKDILVRLAVEGHAMEQNKAANLQYKKKDDNYFRAKSELYKSKEKKDAVWSRYTQVQALLEQQLSKIDKAEKMLKSIYEKLEKIS